MAKRAKKGEKKGGKKGNREQPYCNKPLGFNQPPFSFVEPGHYVLHEIPHLS
jgi:hypothetical protein